MRLAIPVWNDRISPVLDVAQKMILFDLDGKRVINHIPIILSGDSLTHRVIKLKENRVDLVLCGAVSEVLHKTLINQDIEVFPWLTGKIDEVLPAFVSGQICKARFKMPGCRGQTQRRRKRGTGREHHIRINEDKHMKVAVTANGTTLDADIDPRFGRARYFLIIDPESKEITVHDNQQNQQAAGGAGIQAAEAIVNGGAGVLLTGHCGPKAFRALKAAGIKIVLGVEGSVDTVIETYNDGKYAFADSADVESHW
jgi:predicted Fe-Mo cluster-binding NifX family protein